MRRKLAVILASDVADYSGLVAADEEATIQRFTEISELFKDQARQHGGRIFNTAGDAILAEFDSAVNATRCAIDIQDATKSKNAALRDEQRLLFRMGIAIGDVIIAANDDLLGDGVNIAARLQFLAEPGGICVSQDVQNHVANKIALGFSDLGPQSLKNIPRPIHAYRVVFGPKTISARLKFLRRPRYLVFATATGAVVTGVTLWFLSSAPLGLLARQPLTSPLDPSAVPFISDRVRYVLVQDYLKAPDHKALAIAISEYGRAYGVAVAQTNSATARELALRLPVAAEVRTKPTDVPLRVSEVPTNASMRSLIQNEYMKEGNDRKVLAIGSNAIGYASDPTSVEDAARRALENCAHHNGAPCVIYAVDKLLTVRLPRSRAVIGVFTLATSPEISDPERARLANIYSGTGWRAIARGASGKWYGVADAALEIEAVERALQECSKADQDCSIRVIDSFRVSEPR